MKSLYKVFWIAGVEFRKFFTLKHLFVMLFSYLFLGEYIIRRMVMVSRETGFRINELEPVNLILSHSFYAMVIPLTFTVLLSDFPDKSSGGIFIMVRLKRTLWFLGQLIFSMMAGAVYFGFLVFAGILFVGRAGNFSLKWSPYTTKLYVEYPEIYEGNVRLFLEAGTVSHGTPVSVFLTSFFLMMCCFLTIAQILCLFKFVRHRRAGLFVSVGLTISGAAAAVCAEKGKWFFPMAHCIYGIHFHDFYAKPECRLIYSVIYFSVFNAVLFFVNRRLAGKCMIGDAEK